MIKWKVFGRGTSFGVICVFALIASATYFDTAQAAEEGSERPVETLPPTTVASYSWLDFNGDQRLDLAIITASGRLKLLANTGRGGFADVTLQAGLSDVANASVVEWADYDDDGRLDLFVGARDGTSRLFHREAAEFVDVTAASGLDVKGAVLSAQWLDSDGDGHLDLFAVEDGACTLSLGGKSGTFETSPLPLEGIGLPWNPGTPGALVLAPAGTPEGLASPDRKLGRSTTVQRSLVTGGGGSGGGSSLRIPFPKACAAFVRDQANPAMCISASSTPTLGNLYPLSSDLFVAPNGKVGMGTTTPTGNLDVINSNAAAWMRLSGGDNRNAVLSLLEANDDQRGFEILHQGQDKALLFVAHENSAVGEVAMAINRDDGFIGMGTIRPASARLTVGGQDASLWIAGERDNNLTFAAGTPTEDQSGIHIYNDSVTGKATIRAHDFVAGTPRDLFINDTGGNVRIGVDGTVPSLFVADNDGVVIFGDLLTAGFKLDVNGAVRASSFMDTSSRKLKRDIVPIEGALDAVLRLRGVHYTWNEQAPESMRGQRDLGFVADEVAEVLPDIVKLDDNGEAIAVNYGKVSAVAVEAIKELKAENDALRARIERIEAALAPQVRESTK